LPFTTICPNLFGTVKDNERGFRARTGGDVN
jgi:hypothetical protein